MAGRRIHESWRHPSGLATATNRRARWFPSADRFPAGVRFLDVEAPETREGLRHELASILAFYGYDDLDVAVVRGADRRITRWIGQWAYDQSDERGNPMFAGVRYLSPEHRLGMLGCI